MDYNRDTYHLKRSITMRLGPTELIIILIIVLLLFGVGRIGKIAGELGSGIRAFKDGLQGDKENPTETPAKEEKATKE
jgi:sec-independent protein translocase protein TatA